MNDQFFQDSTPEQGQDQHTSPNNEPQVEDDEFDFANEQPAQNNGGFDNFSSPQMNFDSNQGYHSQSASQIDDEVTLKIRQEEQRIQEQLREKSNQEYEQKQERIERGRKQLEEYLEKKEEERADRKRENVEKQSQAKADLTKESGLSGWKKVGANVALKQGEHPSKKDVGRMRESIINKRNDES